MTTSCRPPFAATGVLATVACLAATLLAMAGRYGPHRDELYFVSAGHRLAWGYPDQPAFTPMVARLAEAVAPGNLVVLRLPSLLAVCLLVVLTAAFARLAGGGRAAQTLAAVTVAAGGLTVAVGHRLSTATFDVLAWTAVLLVVGHALADDRPRLWLLAGLVAGVGLNNKHAVVLLLAGVLVGVAAVGETRWQLRTPYPWLGGLLALLLWLPNLVWQARDGWPVLELSRDIATEYGGLLGRVELVGQALVMFSPLIAVVWVWGLVRLLRDDRLAPLRPVAVCFLAVLGVFLVTGGKGYYLAGLVAPLLAVGCTALAERWRDRRRLVAAGAVLAASAVVAWPALVPVLPVRTYAGSFYTALDSDQLETIGWPELVATARSALDELPPEQRARAVVFTGNYGEAGALEWYGVGRPVLSGHNGFRDWGPPTVAGPVVVVGWAPPQASFVGCRPAGQVHNRADADNDEEGVPVWVCEGPRGSWEQQWPRLSHLDA